MVYFEDDKKSAQKVVEDFHQLFKDENYSEMYGRFSDETRKSVAVDEFTTAFKKLHSEMGKIKQSKLVNSEVKAQASVRVVGLAYETEFENGSLIEKFSCLTDGENAVIDVYVPPTKLEDGSEK
jgi:Protein of unknown function (DUF3887)